MSIDKSNFKVCSSCNESKPCSEFHKNKHSKDGFYNKCKKCKSEYGKKYRLENKEIIKQRKKKYRDENKDKIKEYSKKYYEANAEELRRKSLEYHYANREEKNKKVKEWKIENKDKVINYRINNRDKNREYRRKYREKDIEADNRRSNEWRKKNYDKVSEYMKKWISENKDKCRKYNQKRRASKKSNGGSYTDAEWEECLEFFNYKCAYSGRKMERVSADHIIPLSKGGTSYISNIVPCELRINDSKGSKDLEEWYLAQEFYSDERYKKIKEWINKRELLGLPA